MLVIHDEPKNAPARATAEAVKGLPARADRERGRFLLMKWAERLEICAGAFERKIRADHVDDVIRGSDLLDRFRRDRSHARLIIFRLVWLLKRCQTYAVRRCFQPMQSNLSAIPSGVEGSRRAALHVDLGFFGFASLRSE